MTSPRVFELDLLRGIAILLVLGVHSPTAPGEVGVLRPIDLFLHGFGWTGVDLFFVLSGFLIGGLLFAEIKRDQNIVVGRFLVRRVFRIWPAYYALLLFAFVQLSLTGGVAAAWSATWPSVVHLQNFLGAPRDQLWSLAIEEHFYLLLPAFLWLAIRHPKDRDGWTLVASTCLLLTVVCLGLRFIAFQQAPKAHRFATYLRLDSLFFGVTLAHLQAFRPHVLRAIAAKRGGWLLGLLLLVPALDKGIVRDTVGFTGLYLGYGLLLVKLIYREHRGGAFDRGMSSPIVRLLGVIGTSSYSIYLWHRDTLSWQGHLFATWVGHRLHLPSPMIWVLHTLAYVICSVVGGIVMGKLIETPALKLRDRLFPSKTASVPALTR